MKVFKVELLIIDFDEVGEAEIKAVIQNTKYPNYCISPEVKSIEVREIEWSDEHPLNHRDTCEMEYQKLFNK